MSIPHVIHSMPKPGGAWARGEWYKTKTFMFLCGGCFWVAFSRVFPSSPPPNADTSTISTTPHNISNKMIERTTRYKQCVEMLRDASAAAAATTDVSNNNDNDKNSSNTRRNAILDRMKQFSSPENPADMLIIGGGAVGSGAALEGSAKGLKVVLAEGEDFASGASSKSTKLIHGGVRYLESAVLGVDLSQLKLVFEALSERNVLLSQAPHLCRELPTFVPCYSRFELAWFWAGMKVYDLVGRLGGSTLPKSRIVYPVEAHQWFPTLRGGIPSRASNNKTLGGGDTDDKDKPPDDGKEEEQEHHPPALQHKKGGDEEDLNHREKLVGGILYYDGQMDDARLNVSVALTANVLGAACGNYCRVEKFILSNADKKDEQDNNNDASKKRRVIGAVVRDKLSGESFPVYARLFLNATGAYSDVVRNKLLSAVNGDDDANDDDSSADHQQHLSSALDRAVVPSVGTHITLPQSLTLGSTNHHGGSSSPALLIPKTKDGRVLFVAPWNGRTIAGTTDRTISSDDLLVADHENNNNDNDNGSAKRATRSSHPTKPNEDDVNFILDTMRPYFNVPINRSDVISTWSGIRPLASSFAQRGGGGRGGEVIQHQHQHQQQQQQQTKQEKSSSSSSIIREHVVFPEDDVDGFASIVGGKWTTYNRMACDALAQSIDMCGDAELKVKGKKAHITGGSGHETTMSRYLKLIGGQHVPYNFENVCTEALDKTTQKLLTLSSNNSSVRTARAANTDIARHLATSYGDRAFLILNIIKEQEEQQNLKQRQQQQEQKSWWWSSLFSSSAGQNHRNKNIISPLQLINPSLPILAAEVTYACRHELCETPADFLCRRSRAAFLDANTLLLLQQQNSNGGGCGGGCGDSAVETVARVMATEKGWDERRIESEVKKTLHALAKGFSTAA